MALRKDEAARASNVRRSDRIDMAQGRRRTPALVNFYPQFQLQILLGAISFIITVADFHSSTTNSFAPKGTRNNAQIEHTASSTTHSAQLIHTQTEHST